MELRHYWAIVYRRLWVVVLLVAVVVGASWAIREPPGPMYQASMRFILGISPQAREGDYYTYDHYYAWLSSEYLVDDFTEIVRSEAFAEDVSTRLTGRDIFVSAGAIQGSAFTQKQHRILTLTITWPDRLQAQEIGRAAAAALREESTKYFAQLGSEGAEIHLIDEPQVSQAHPSLRERLDLPLRGVVALLTGLGLAFLLDYLDDTVRSAEELESLGLRVLGEIPGEGIWWRRIIPRKGT